jgi:hypothetical protein
VTQGVFVTGLTSCGFTGSLIALNYSLLVNNSLHFSLHFIRIITASVIGLVTASVLTRCSCSNDVEKLRKITDYVIVRTWEI